MVKKWLDWPERIDQRNHEQSGEDGLVAEEKLFHHAVAAFW